MKKLIFTLAVSAIAFAGCKKTDDSSPVEEPASTNLNLPNTIFTSPISSDPTEVSSSLEVKSGERKSGSAPASTGNPDSPTISGLFVTQEETSFSGGTFAVPVTASTSGTAEIKGLFVEVENANSYLDIPISALRTKTATSNIGESNSSTNLKKITTMELPIQLPTNFGIGKFCIKYSVYDAKGNVSNKVTKCINVKKLGGSDNLVKDWYLSSMTVEKLEGTAQPSGTYDTLPVPGGFSHFYTLNCGGIMKNIKTEKVFNKMNINLKANGEFESAYDTEILEMSKANDPCSASETKTSIKSSAYGAWSLNTTDKTISLIYQSETINDLTFKLNDVKVFKIDSQDGKNAINLASMANTNIKLLMK